MEEAIGGYLSLELYEGKHYHPNALRLNSARNCFEYVLRVRRYRKVFIPYYTCEVMLEPLIKLGVEYEFYTINTDFEPVCLPALKSDEAFLYTNYFGLKQIAVCKLAGYYGKQLIVDNAQAFFASPIEGIDTFYSPRKFVGVADGGYLYIDQELDIELPQDISYNRMSHLLKRIDLQAEEGYPDFQQNDNELIGQPIKRMSKLTEAVLCSVGYDAIRQKRRDNYKVLDAVLGKKNKSQFPLREEDVPMVYPYYCEKEKLRKSLIENRIFVATYWPNVLEWVSRGRAEYKCVRNIIPLPVDQRYNHLIMNRIIKIVNT